MRYLFASIDPSLIDLEWIAPVVSGYQNLGNETEVICLFTPKSEYEKFWVNLLAGETSNIFIGTRAFDSASQLVQSIENICDRIKRRLKITFNNKNNSCSKEDQNRRSLRRINGLANWVSGATAIFVPYIKESPFLSPNGDAAILLTAAKKMAVPIISYPPAVSAFHTEISHVKKFDVMLLTAPSQITALSPSFRKKAVAIGAPKFGLSWRAKVKKKYENGFAKSLNIPENRELVLVILKNDTSILWNGLDFLKTTRKLINNLRRSDRILVLKPHPRQTKGGLEALLDGIPKDEYIVDYGPVSYWASRTKISVSLFSGGAIDALAEGKVPYIYWPVDSKYRDLLKNKGTPDHYIKLDSKNKIITQFDDLACVITSIKFNMPEVSSEKYRQSFEETFRPYQSIIEFKQIVDQLLSETVQKQVT